MSEDTLHIIINVILSIFCIIWVHWDFFKRKDEFWQAIKGSDNKLQIEEIIAYVWVRIFPVLVFADLFLNFSLRPEVWYSLDLILVSLVGGNVLRETKKKSEK